MAEYEKTVTQAIGKVISYCYFKVPYKHVKHILLELSYGSDNLVFAEMGIINFGAEGI